MENKSGVSPIEYKVLVKPDDVDDVTSGGIYIPDKAHDQHQVAQQKGILIAAGHLAFTDDNGAPWLDSPQVGDRVLINSYAGSRFRGADMCWYRLLPDKEVCAIITDDIPDELTGTRKGLGLVGEK